MLSDQNRFSGIRNPELSAPAQKSAIVGNRTRGLSPQCIAMLRRWTMSRVESMSAEVASMQVLKGSRWHFCNVTFEPLCVTEVKDWIRCVRLMNG